MIVSPGKQAFYVHNLFAEGVCFIVHIFKHSKEEQALLQR